MREDALDHCGLLNSRDGLQLPPTVREVLDVDIAHPLQQLRPTHAPLRVTGKRARAVACTRRGGCSLIRYRHHHFSQLSVRCRYPMKADQMQTRPGHQRDQSLHEFHRRHHVVAAAITPLSLEFQYDMPAAVDGEPLVGIRRAGDGAA